MATSEQQRQFAVEVVKTLRDASYEALWAGGCVRDALLGIAPKDYDVATSARPEQVRQLFGKRRTLAIGAAFGVISVLGNRSLDPIEVATFRTDGNYLNGRHPDQVTFSTAEEDARRRDFTINGLFYDPLADQVIDYVGGEDDLRLQVVRAIGDPQARFSEDKLRMLRAIRMATTFGFAIDPATMDAIERMAPEIEVVSAERIGIEVGKILLHANRTRGVTLLRESGLLPVVLPEGDSLRQSDPAAWERSLETFQRLDEPTLPMVLAALLHETQDSATIRELGRRLRYPNKLCQRAGWLVEKLPVIAAADRIRWPALQRVLVEPGSDELLGLASSIYGDDHPGIRHARAKLRLPVEQLNPPPLVTGHDLLEVGINPGRRFAELLDFVRDAQLEEQISSTEEAIELARQWQKKAGLD